MERAGDASDSLPMLRTCLCVVLLAAPAAFACECKETSPGRIFQTADAVFEATTLEPIAWVLWPPGEDGKVRVKVGRRWKGVDSGSGELELRVKSGKACGYQFKEKTSYLVFATKHGDGLQVSLCSATRPLANAKGELEKLPPPAP